MPREREEFVPRCETCGYNLTGLTESRCPECGELFNPVEVFQRFENYAYMPRRSFLGVYLIVFVAPVLVSVAAAFVAMWVAATIAGMIALPIFAGFFIMYLMYVAQRVVDRVRNARHGSNGLIPMIQESGVGMVVFLQIVAVLVFWFLAFVLILANPPQLFPRFIETVVERKQLA